MNIQALNSAVSPFQLWLGRSNQSNPMPDAGWRTHHPRHEANSPRLGREDVQKIVENRLKESIQKSTDGPFIHAPTHIGTALDTDQLAERILANIAKTYGQQIRANPNFDKANFLSQVKQGVAEGFAQAREALDQLGLLNDAQNASLDDAYATIQDGLAKLEALNANPVNVNEVRTQGLAAQISQSTAIEIVTKQGDVVKISLASAAAMSHSLANVKQNGNEATAFESRFESHSDFSISIEGNLNEDEQESLNNLLKQMDKVGSAFFGDNMQAAFKQAQNMGLDTEQLASFSLDLSMAKSVQAISTYQQTAAPEQNLPADKIKNLEGFLNRVKTELQPAQDALKPFADPTAAFNSLYEAVSRLLNEKYAAQDPVDALPLLRGLAAKTLNV